MVELRNFNLEYIKKEDTIDTYNQNLNLKIHAHCHNKRVLCSFSSHAWNVKNIIRFFLRL